MPSSPSDEFESVSDEEQIVEELEEEEEVVEDEIEEVEEVEEFEEEEVEEEVEVEEGNEGDGRVEEDEKIVERDVEGVEEVVKEEEAEDLDMEIDESDDDERRLGEDKKNCNVIHEKKDEEQDHGKLLWFRDKVSEIDGGDARFHEKPSEQDEPCLIYARKRPLKEAYGDNLPHKGSDYCTGDKVATTLAAVEVGLPLGDNIHNGPINGVKEKESSSNFISQMHPPEHFLIPSVETPRKRPRSLTPVANHDSGEERSSMVCVYFAKGWCIKGNSCRFLHQKDGVIGIREPIVGDLSGPSKKRQLPDNEGPRPEIERPRSLALNDGFASTTGGHSDSKLLQKALVRTYGGVAHGSITAQELPKMDTFGNRVSSPCINEYNKLLVRQELLRTCRNSSFKEKFGPHYELNESNSGEKNFIPKLYPDERRPHHDAYYTAGSNHLSGSLSYEKRVDFDAHKNSMAPEITPEFDSGLETYRSAPLPRDSLLHYPPSESQNAAQLSVPGDLSPNTSLRMHLKPDAWEPSKPFRSSFLSLSAKISSPESQYDPLHDSNEATNAVAGTSATSNVSCALSLGKQQLSNSLFQNEENSPICNATANSVFQANDRLPADASEDASSGTAATLGPCKLDGSNSIYKEERGSSQGVAIANEAGPNSMSQSDMDGHNMESKAMRIFRTVLVDYIKDLVRPFWRGGQLSKDAHKMVVKKAVEKVFGALQPDQIPNSIELVNHYLASSRPKLIKLVEAYVGKYSRAGAPNV